MAKTTNEIISNLIKKSVRVYSDMITTPQLVKTNPKINVDYAPKFSNNYVINNSIICFVCEGLVFITPYTNESINSLRKAGFCEGCFNIPDFIWEEIFTRNFPSEL